MRKSLGLVSALALIAGLGASTTGSHGVVGGISRMLTPVAEAAPVEHQSAIDASTGNYAVIAPTFLGNANSAFSVIRLISAVGAPGSATTSTFSLTVVGVPSGQVYGRPFTVAVPHLATIGLGLSDIVKDAGAQYQAFTNGDIGYAVYISNPDPESGYQHTTYNGNTQLYENMSNCASLFNEQLTSLDNEMFLANLQTSGGPNHLGVNYPSTVVIHNYYNAPITYTLTGFNAGGLQIYNGSPNANPTAVTANSGKLTCQLAFTVGANSSRPIAMTEIESNPLCRLDSDEDYMNVIIANQTGAAPNAVFTHMIHVAQYGGDTNVSDTCAVNKVTGGASGAGAGGGGFSFPPSPYL